MHFSDRHVEAVELNGYLESSQYMIHNVNGVILILVLDVETVHFHERS